ncbi:PREDICTED: uncharacterized protein LOC108978251 [Bactrocera latifrons]|uniref:uncharacterized protein LOC108978251 n=1 Tax=Bactrocera latifrons TaxID=174628 RepID=UPI0008DCD6BD|nr:PREDICTED: uncharacterized protein LOC108978251 [Bactrocera latifrons]
MQKIELFVFCAFLVYSCVKAVEIDCRRPPQLVQPSLCCKNEERAAVMETCAQRLGLSFEKQKGATALEDVTCFAECIVKELQHLSAPEKINFEAVQKYLQTKSGNDTTYVDTMLTAYRKCVSVAQQRMQVIKQHSLGGGVFALRSCSPFSGILLSCVHMEYFMNCPANRWTDNAECALAKQFVTQCAIGTV